MKEKVVFGIDVGGTTVKCGLFTTEGKLLEMWEIPTRTENGGAAILPDVARTVKDKIRERGLDAAAFWGSASECPGRSIPGVKWPQP